MPTTIDEFGMAVKELREQTAAYIEDDFRRLKSFYCIQFGHGEQLIQEIRRLVVAKAEGYRTFMARISDAVNSSPVPGGKLIWLHKINGNDDNDGASPECAVQSMKRVDELMTAVEPGDDINLVITSSGPCKYDTCMTLVTRQGEEE